MALSRLEEFDFPNGGGGRVTFATPLGPLFGAPTVGFGLHGPRGIVSAPRPMTPRKQATAAALSTPETVDAQVAARKLGLPTAPNPKLAAIECAAKGGTMIGGRCVQLKTVRAPGLAPGAQVVQQTARQTGGPVMGIRASLISSSSFLPSAGAGATVLGGLVQGGLDILNTFVASKFGAAGVASPSPTPLATASMGGLIPAGGPVGLAAVSGAIVAAGGAIVGTVIRISRAAWVAIPTLIKQAAIALGLTVAFTDIELIGGGGGAGELSQAQQRKISRFQQLTGAGVPPGIAARATGIGRRRRRGISAFELSGFRKISHLLGHVGMVPRGLRGARPRRGHHHK